MSTSDNCSLLAENAEKTAQIGHSLAVSLYGYPVTIFLHGDLGAGKTTFVQGLAKGLGITGHVVSPTFALQQQYETALGVPFTHIDLYRLEAKDAPELIRQTSEEGICCIEWAERLPEHMRSQPSIDVHLQEEGAGRRCDVTFRDIAIPTREQVLEWREEVMLPSHVGAHCDQVAAVTELLAQDLLRRGIVVRPLAARRAAELHDLLRFFDFRPEGGMFPVSSQEQKIWDTWKAQYPNQKHEEAAAAFLREHGFPEIAQMVVSHGLHTPPGGRTTIEQDLLYYADKRVALDKIVSLEERFEDFKNRYGKGALTPQSIQWKKEALDVEKRLFPDDTPV